MKADREPQARLKSLWIRGFKSIENQSLELTDLDVLIGPNGAGKSNLIGFLRMVGFMLSSEHGLANFVGRSGGASALLHDGPKQTREIEARLSIATQLGINDYEFRLGHASGDSLIFLEERCRFSSSGKGSPNPRWIDLGSGGKFPQLIKASEDAAGKTKRTVLRLLQGLSVYQFHDTSDEAPMKQRASMEDSRYLRGDGRNLASFLLNMREHDNEYYQRIVDTVRLIAPFFDDFVLEPEFGKVLLCWREVRSGIIFGPGQISDGTLRVIALLTLLLQSPRTMPPILVLDEPELGLHPFAVRIVAGAIKAASKTHQCVIATQSPALLNEFDTSNIVVVERKARSSEFRRLESDDLAQWVSEYQLSDLWDMNLLGGRPEPMAAE